MKPPLTMVSCMGALSPSIQGRKISFLAPGPTDAASSFMTS